MRAGAAASSGAARDGPSFAADRSGGTEALRASLDGLTLAELKRLCLVLTVEMGLVVREAQPYGRHLDLTLESTVLLRPRNVLLRLTTAVATEDDLRALTTDANDAGCADYLLLSTRTSTDPSVTASQHFLGPGDLVDLCKRSHAVGWVERRPVARDDMYVQTRRRAADLAELDTLGLSWLPALSRNRLPWALRDSSVPADEWFEVTTFGLLTRLFRMEGRRLGAASRGKRVGDALLWRQDHLFLLDCKAAQDGYRLEINDERRLVEYARQRHVGLPTDRVGCVVLVSSGFPIFEASRRRFEQRRREFTGVGSDLACVRADDLVDAAILVARKGDETRHIDTLPWHRIFAEGIVTRDELLGTISSAIAC
ncbi:hypothetical protein GCM10009557_00820 [Virgisporangium ochraceum]|uniref:Uncharacterized protein n=1 Tax=Virgisporangium ochraceum TaxID=65505 RepID=A0A8J4A1J3_9ACTN|nr:hypothetical protein [Virgisporangium ochraceum]GIJ74114.1 hypothetical protein Voc01_090310 [Virgisporangium ochraceum]